MSRFGPDHAFLEDDTQSRWVEWRHRWEGRCRVCGAIGYIAASKGAAVQGLAPNHVWRHKPVSRYAERMTALVRSINP